MSFDVTTLALAKSYTNQHGGSGGGTSTADGISYTNEYLVGTTNVKGALDVLVPKSHTHTNKDTLDKLSVTDGKLQYNGSDVGADGKSAYQYAQDGGYTGTETEFSEKLAQEQLTGTTDNLTPTQVYNAVSSGIPVKVQYTDRTYGPLYFTAFNVAESFNLIVSQTIVYVNKVYILAELNGDKSDNSWDTAFTTLAEKKDIPTVLPNPNSINITVGDALYSYNGSETVNVVIDDGTEVSY